MTKDEKGQGTHC